MDSIIIKYLGQWFRVGWFVKCLTTLCIITCIFGCKIEEELRDPKSVFNSLDTLSLVERFNNIRIYEVRNGLFRFTQGDSVSVNFGINDCKLNNMEIAYTSDSNKIDHIVEESMHTHYKLKIMDLLRHMKNNRIVGVRSTSKKMEFYSTYASSILNTIAVDTTKKNNKSYYVFIKVADEKEAENVIHDASKVRINKNWYCCMRSFELYNTVNKCKKIE